MINLILLKQENEILRTVNAVVVGSSPTASMWGIAQSGRARISSQFQHSQ